MRLPLARRLMCFASFFSLALAQEEGMMDIGLDPPKFSEEEQYSLAMPEGSELKCDACSIVMQNFASVLLQAEALRGRPLKEYQVDGVIEQLCAKGLANYEVLEIEGKKRFDVPGAFPPNKEAGHVIKSTSGLWSDRLRAACRGVVGELGEEDIYSRFRRHMGAPGAGAIPVASETATGADAFVREACSEKPAKPGKSGKGRGKRRASSQGVLESCSGHPPLFTDVGWAELTKKTGSERHKLEL